MVNIMNNKEYVIHVDLEEKQDLYDEYNWNILNDKLANYIDKQISKSRFRDKIIIEISAGFMLTKEKEKMRNCIISHYKDVLIEINFYEKSNNIKKIMLFLLGVIFLILSNSLVGTINKVFVELLNIAGWVAIWEIVYIVLFTDNERKFKRLRARQLIKSKITFK